MGWVRHPMHHRTHCSVVVVHRVVTVAVAVAVAVIAAGDLESAVAIDDRESGPLRSPQTRCEYPPAPVRRPPWATDRRPGGAEPSGRRALECSAVRSLATPIGQHAARQDPTRDRGLHGAAW